MRTLTEWEVEEFIEQAQARPALWIGKDKTWIRRRRREGQNLFAVKFENGLPHGMSALHVLPLGETSEEVALQHVEHMLCNFTSFAWRKSVEELLRLRLLDGAEDLARIICMPKGFIEKHVVADSSQQPKVQVVAEAPAKQYQADLRPDLENEGCSDARTPKTLAPQRSRYLQNLVKKAGASRG